MKAMQLNNAGQQPALIPAELPKPEPGAGEILIQVHAAAVTPTELLWYPTSHTKSGAGRTGAVPGHEFSGVVAAIGKAVQKKDFAIHDFAIGAPVYGLHDGVAGGAA